MTLKNKISWLMERLQRQLISCLLLSQWHKRIDTLFLDVSCISQMGRHKQEFLLKIEYDFITRTSVFLQHSFLWAKGPPKLRKFRSIAIKYLDQGVLP